MEILKLYIGTQQTITTLCDQPSNHKMFSIFVGSIDSSGVVIKIGA